MAALSAQAPAPGSETTARAFELAARLGAVGRDLLDREDPLGALEVFRRLRALEPADVSALCGLGKSHLLLGEASIAVAYAEAALRRAPRDDEALGLWVRAKLRAREFRAALCRSTEAIADGNAGVHLLAAHASALFRMQRIDEAAETYRRVLAIDPMHAEAHLRLGSGLCESGEAVLGPDGRAGMAAARDQHYDEALAQLTEALRIEPQNPVVHRLIGETLYNQRAQRSMASAADEFRRLQQALPQPAPLDVEVVDRFMPAFADLGPERRRVASRALALFRGELRHLVQKGGCHDLMMEWERTTDHPSRAALRGRRTFDGRVWDDVRGIGGLRAATGIEALDEAAQYGFDTLAHEIAHQAHLHGFRRSVQVRIRDLYRQALAEGRCLDFYAASNYAEYFGQGVEAFVSYGKRPTYEATHGHTRFELLRVDPGLHELIRSLVSFDPLDPLGPEEQRLGILRSSIEVALRCGRPADAVTAAELLPVGAERDARLSQAKTALSLSESL